MPRFSEFVDHVFVVKSQGVKFFFRAGMHDEFGVQNPNKEHPGWLA